MVLFRYFKDRAFAISFLEGHIRFTAQRQYRGMTGEPGLGDTHESDYSYFQDNVLSTNSHASDTKILCTSTVLSDELKRDFGEFVIEIADAERFSRVLNTGYRRTLSDRCFSDTIEEGTIIYRRADDPPLESIQTPRSNIFCKRLDYRYQSEYRFAFIEKDRFVDGARIGSDVTVIQLSKDEISQVTQPLFSTIQAGRTPEIP